MTSGKTKRCSRCTETKGVSDFYDNQWRNGSWCKTCYRDDYAGRSSEVRWQKIAREYKLSKADYTRMLEAQQGVCAICQKPERAKRFKFLAVDHDHCTNKVRGLLCHRCNAGLGNFNDDVKLIRVAADYLEKQQIEGASAYSSSLAGALKIFRVAVHSSFPEFAVDSCLSGKAQSSALVEAF